VVPPLSTLRAVINPIHAIISRVFIGSNTNPYLKGRKLMGKLRFDCNYCPASFPRVKQLFDHAE